MGRYGFDFGFDASSTVRGGEDTSTGMHFFGEYFGSNDEGTTEDIAFEVFFYVYDSNGDRFPSTPATYSSQVTALIAGTQVVAILDVLSGESLNKNVTLNLTTVFTITTSGGTAIGTAPTIASTISGGAYNQALPMTGILYRIDTLAEGDNTVSAYYKDPNGDEYTSDNTIAIRFASTAPIIEIDGVDVINPISTTEFEVDVTYLYGGSLLFDAGEQVTDTGETLYYGGTEVTVLNYALLPAANNVQVLAETDDFGQSFDTTIQLVTKIPAIINNGLTTIDEETFGTTYAATGILDIDTGAPYQVLGATPDEAPYTFTSGLYQVYNKTASYTYLPSGVSNSVAYPITYQEFAVVPFDLKIFDYTTDEFLFLDEQDNVTPLIEPNGHPSGTMVFNHVASPDYTDPDLSYYHATESLNLFKETPSQGSIAIQEPPHLNTSLQVSVGKGNYMNGGLSSTIFTPENPWFISGYFVGTGSYYVCGRQGTTAANGTSIEADNGNLVVKIGGTDYGSAIAYDTSLVHYIRWKNWFDGADWVDSLLLDETIVYTARSTARGTNTNSLLPTIGCIWNVDTEVDPDTDAQQGHGGNYSALRFGTENIDDQKTKGLYLRYTKHFLTCIGGDSIPEGVTTGDFPIWVQLKDEANRYEYKTSYVCTAKGGTSSFNSLPVTPIDDWTSVPPWTAIGISPTADQSCEYVLGLNPDLYIDSFGYNDINFGFNQENPDAGVDSTPASLGWNTYGDVPYWVAKNKKNWFDTNDVPYFCGLAYANGKTTLVYDGVEIRDMARNVNDLIIANRLTDVDDFIISAWYETRETGTNNIDPALTTDDIHVNQAGATVIVDRINEVSEIDLSFILTREINFKPVIKFIDPTLDGTVNTSPYDIIWWHDGTQVTDNTALTEGSNPTIKNFTNTKGLIGQKTSDIQYVIIPPFDGFKYDLTAEVSGEFIDQSGNDEDATISGTPTFAGGKWDLTRTNDDYCYTLGSEADMDPDDEWSHSVWCTLKTVSSPGEMIFSKFVGTSFGNSTGLYHFQANLVQFAWGSQTTVGSAPSVGSEFLLGWQNRNDGGTRYLDTYIDGVLLNSISARGAGSNTLPVILGCAVGSTTDPTAATSFCFDGELRYYAFQRGILTTQDWLDRFNAGAIPV